MSERVTLREPSTPRPRRSRRSRWRDRPRIAVDMDEVIADSDGKHLRVYNRMFGETLTMRDLHGRSLDEAVPPDRAQAVRALLLDPTFYADLDVIAGACDGVRALTEVYDVYIATAAMEVPTAFAAKFAWLARHFPFIPPTNIVFCGRKNILDVDLLVDDSPRHFQGFRGRPILFTSAHNLLETRYTRVNDWRELLGLLLPSGECGPGRDPHASQPLADPVA